MLLSSRMWVSVAAVALLVGTAAAVASEDFTSLTREPLYADSYATDSRDVLSVSDREAAPSAAPAALVEYKYNDGKPKSFRLGPYETRFPFLSFVPEGSDEPAYPYYYQQHDGEWTKVLSKWRYIMADPHPRSKRKLTEEQRQFQIRKTKLRLKNELLGFGDDDPEDDEEAYDDFDPLDTGVIIEPTDARTDRKDLKAALRHPLLVVRTLAKYYKKSKRSNDKLYKKFRRAASFLEKSGASTRQGKWFGKTLKKELKKQLTRAVTKELKRGVRKLNRQINRAVRTVTKPVRKINKILSHPKKAVKKAVKKGKKAVKKTVKKSVKKGTKAVKKTAKKGKKKQVKKQKKGKKAIKKQVKKTRKALKKATKAIKKRLASKKKGKAYVLPADLPHVHPADHPAKVEEQMRAINKQLAGLRKKLANGRSEFAN